MKNFFAKKIYKYIVIFFALPFFSYAQTVDVSFSPTSPAAGQTVTVSVRSVDLDLNNKEITWYKDGKKDKSGTGLRNFSFILENKTTPIRVSVKDGGKFIERFLNINPNQIDMLWEVVGGHKPPFYKGKVLPVKTSSVKVTAIPQVKNEKGLVSDPKTFVYSWQKDNANVAGQSGYGRNSFVYSSNVLDRSNDISVSASGGSVVVVGGANIPFYNPSINFYEYNNVYGPFYNKALKNNQRISTRTFNVIAEPYFIKRDLSENSVVSAWKINDQAFSSLDKNLILLNVAENVNNFRVGVKFDLQGELLQGVERSINLSI